MVMILEFLQSINVVKKKIRIKFCERAVPRKITRKQSMPVFCQTPTSKTVLIDCAKLL